MIEEPKEKRYVVAIWGDGETLYLTPEFETEAEARAARDGLYLAVEEIVKGE